MIKIVLTVFLLSSYSLAISLKSVKKNVSYSNEEPERHLLMEEANMPSGNVYVEQLQNTNSNLNEMMTHGRREGQMKQVGQWFLDIDERMDDFRDAVSRKLNELHMALSKPHLSNMINPMMGPQMMNPMMNPMMGGGSKGGSQMVDEEEEADLDEGNGEEGDEEDDDRRHRRRRMRRRYMHI